MLEFYPVGNPILLAHIWILHKILDRIAPILFCFKKFYLKSKYPNRAVLYSEVSKKSDDHVFSNLDMFIAGQVHRKEKYLEWNHGKINTFKWLSNVSR